MTRPPPLFERLLLRAVGRDVRGRSIAGDLLEEYAHRPPSLFTNVHYAVACLRVAVRYLPARLVGTGQRSIQAFVLELRQSARGLHHAPIYWVGCAMTLAMGIGAATTIGTIVYGAILRPLPFPHADRLVRVGDASLRNPIGLSSVSIPNFLDLQRRSRVFDVLAAFRSRRAIVSGPEQSVRLSGAFVTPNFFDVFELPPLAGRWIELADDGLSAPPVVILSRRAWQRLFGGRRDAVGQQVQIDLVDHTLIGIADENQIALGAVDFWTPARWDAEALSVRRRRSIEPLGRLREGSTVDQARAELRVLFAELRRQYPVENGGWTINVISIEEWIGSFGGVGSRPMLRLIGAGALVLLAVAVINVSSLTLGRAEQRRRDVLIRRALGATRGRLFLQQMSEGVLIGVPAGLAGAWLASWAVPLAVARYGDAIPRATTIAFDGTGGFLAAASGAMAALCIAVLAGFQRGSSQPSIRTDARGSSAASLRLRRGLVVTEVTLAALLLQAAMLVAGTLYALSRIDLGVPLDQATTFAIGLPATRYPDGPSVTRFVEDLTVRLRALPGVQSAGVSTRRPFAGGTNGPVIAVDDPAKVSPLVEYRGVTPALFAALGLRVLQGTIFSGPATAEADRVVISQQLARELFGSAPALSRRVKTGPTAPPLDIIGVVSDFRDFGPLRAAPPTIYFRHGSAEGYATWSFMTVVVRHDGRGSDLAPLIRAALRDIDRGLPMDDVMSLQTLADRSAGTARRTAATLLLWFTLVALALGAIGIYGVIAFSVQRRTRELGIRLAIGDTPAGVRQRIVADGMKLTALGLAFAALGSSWIRRAVGGFVLADATPTSGSVLGTVMAVVAIVALAACLIPARRAARISPVTALRD